MLYRNKGRGKYKRIKPISTKGFSKELLILLAQAGGMLLLTALVGSHPNALAPLARFTRHGLRRLKQLIKRLERQKYLVRQKKGREEIIKITDLGKQKAAFYQLRSLCFSQPAVWDKKWRLVLFDVPNEANIRRHSLSRELRRFGFFPLQKSVFISPYFCPEFIHLLGEATGLERCLIIVETDSLGEEHNERFKKYYQLV